MNDLITVDRVNAYINLNLPVTYNYFLQGGYFIMPSARMGAEGEFAAGYSSVHPYKIYNARFQFLDRLEVSGNYRIFKGVKDPILGETGFGDKADKGLNIKYAILHPQDTDFTFPGLAVGSDDCIGTKGFHSNYIVATQVFPKRGFEISLGYGTKRIRRWFGGALWMPFFCSNYRYLQNLALAVEYDATHYKSHKHEQHPEGHRTKSPINAGIKYRLWNCFDFSLSYIRGMNLAGSVSAFYNFGTTNGIVPKFENPIPYKCCINTQTLGPLRPEEALVQELRAALQEQGLELLEAWLSCDCEDRKILRLRIGNEIYRYEDDVRTHLEPILAYLIPSDIDHIVIVTEGYGFPVNEYHYPMEFVRRYGAGLIGPYELHVISPIVEATRPPWENALHLYKHNPDWWSYDLYPKTQTFFGSSRGKFKYALGLYAGFNGFIIGEWSYTILLGYNAFTNFRDVKDFDRLNPSRLINVRTDIINYLKRKGLSIEEAYLQRNWNLGRGWYAKFAGGLFEIEYGGLASEILYYPVNSHWAFGIECAALRKRTVDGIGFTDKARKLDGHHRKHVKFYGSHFFANLYYDFKELDMDLQLKAGKFLANDWGLRTQLSRYYPSGLRIFFWVTYTNGNDRINGRRYYDKGVGFSLPLDIFLKHSSRQYICYSMSAWLRDVGVTAFTGQSLFDQIQREREKRCYNQRAALF